MAHCPYCSTTVSRDAISCHQCNEDFREPSLGLLESRLSCEQEANIDMPSFIPIALGLLGIGGGAWGALGFIAYIVQPTAISAIVLGLVGLIFYAFGVWCGVLALQRKYGWLWKNTVFWGLQIPIFFTPAISYSFASGAYLNVWASVPPVRAGYDFMLGSKFSFVLFGPLQLQVGANFFAIAVFAYLRRIGRKGVA